MILKYIFALLLTVSVFSLCACNQGGKPPADESARCQPHSLRLETAGDGTARIAWDPGCEGVRIMAGYNIYIQEYPALAEDAEIQLSDLKPFNTDLYPGSIEGDLNNEFYDIENLDNAVRYYAHVRALYGDGSYSAPTNEIEIICFAQGELELAVSYSGENDGFSFANNDFCDTDDLVNDIYYYHRDNQDYICSPARLGPVNRNSQLYTAGEGQYLPNLDKLRPQGDPSDRIAVKPGDNLVLVTVDSHYVGMVVKGFEGTDENRRVILEYFYKPPIKPTSEKA